MKLLRHAPLVGWLLASLGLAAVIGFSLTNQDATALSKLRQPDKHLEFATVDALRGRVLNAYRLAPGGTDYTTWANALARDARQAARVREVSGARRNDQLTKAYRTFASTAEAYGATAPDDRGGRQELAARLAADSDRLATLAFFGAQPYAKGGDGSGSGGSVDPYANDPTGGGDYPPTPSLPAGGR